VKSKRKQVAGQEWVSDDRGETWRLTNGAGDWTFSGGWLKHRRVQGKGFFTPALYGARLEAVAPYAYGYWQAMIDETPITLVDVPPEAPGEAVNPG